MKTLIVVKQKVLGNEESEAKREVKLTLNRSIQSIFRGRAYKSSEDENSNKT